MSTPDQSKTRSETQWSCAAWLFGSLRAEICDMLTIAVTPGFLHGLREISGGADDTRRDWIKKIR